jgi:hypothetical protein
MAKAEICSLCWSCLKGEAPLTDKDDVYKHHVSVSSLYNSVKIGCNFCTRFWQLFEIQTQALLTNDPTLFEFVMPDGIRLLLCQHSPDLNTTDFHGWPSGTHFFSLYMPLWPDSAVLNALFPPPRPAERPSCQWFFVPGLGRFSCSSRFETCLLC